MAQRRRSVCLQFLSQGFPKMMQFNIISEQYVNFIKENISIHLSIILKLYLMII